MRREKKLADELFSPNGPLGSFGTKIILALAYMLRTIDEALYRDLITVSRIRNKFAKKRGYPWLPTCDGFYSDAVQLVRGDR